MTENLGVPIYAWERVRMFPSAEECSIYRMELLENAVSAGSRTKLEEVYRLHCLPAMKMVPPAAKGHRAYGEMYCKLACPDMVPSSPRRIVAVWRAKSAWRTRLWCAPA